MGDSQGFLASKNTPYEELKTRASLEQIACVTCYKNKVWCPEKASTFFFGMSIVLVLNGDFSGKRTTVGFYM